MSLFNKVTKYAKSPQGRKAMDSAQRAAKDPENRKKLEGFLAKRKKTGR
jgi:hypothetical protein